MLVLVAIIAIMLYLGAAVGGCLQLTGKGRHANLPFFGLGLPAVALHAFLLYRWIDVPAGQNLSFLNMFSLAVWLIAVMIGLAGLFKPLRNLRNLCIFVFPLALISICLVLVFPEYAILPMANHLKPLIHILSAVLAFSMLCLAAFQALLLSIQERMLRHKHAGGIINQLPPLETMENLLFQIIGLGFILLTLVLATSLFFFYELLASPQLQQKTLLALIAWIIFAILLGGRYLFGWRGRKVTYYTLSGVVLLVIIYFSGQL
jgi:ABC-type uncharacterized transport system permease subunit